MATDNTIYDLYANPYDFILLNWGPYIELRDMHIASFDNAHQILDFGTGTGNQAVELLEKGKQVVAIDINSTMLGYLNKKLAKKSAYVPTLRMDVQNAGFHDAVFDGVTAMNVIYNVPDPILAMCEAYRVLKNGGIFCLSGPLPTADNRVICNDITNTLINKGLYSEGVEKSIELMLKANEHLVKHATLYSVKELSELLLKEIGFETILFSTDTCYANNAYFVAARK